MSAPEPSPAASGSGPSGSPRVSAVLAGAHADGGYLFGVVAKRTYTVAGDRCSVSPEQFALIEEPVFRAEQGALEHDTDLALQRQRADVIVEGHAYSRGHAATYARIAVGELVRELAVFGDRGLDRTGGNLRFTAPAPFEKIALCWENAYGGVDEAARRAIGDPIAEMLEERGLPHDPRFGLFAYPRNPLGKGYLIEPTADAIDGCRLPNFELPEALLAPEKVALGDFMRWPLGVAVAATGWLSPNYFPRIVQCGLPPRPYHDGEIRPEAFAEVRSGMLRPEAVANMQTPDKRFDIGAAQQSAVGMRAANIPAGAPVQIRGLHPRTAEWRFNLPKEVPRMAYKLPGHSPAVVEPRIRTVLVEPDFDRVTLVWVGEARLLLPLTLRQMEQVEHGVVWVA